MKSNIERMACDRKLTLYALAKRAGVTPECLYKWRKRGIEGATLGALAKVAEALGCKVDDLYD